MFASANRLAWRVRTPIVLRIVLLSGFALLSVLPRPTAAEAEAGSRTVFAPLVLRSAPPAQELLVFDWNGPITIDHHGIPSPAPLPAANSDWTQPIDYAGGSIHMRIEVRRQPAPQAMRLQLCWWQQGRETCTRAAPITGTPGAVATWSKEIARLWSLNNLPVDWTRPRGNGIVIKDGDGDMVSDYGDWNWGGLDPNQWFPLDVRFTAVVVARGAPFSGWHNYVP